MLKLFFRNVHVSISVLSLQLERNELPFSLKIQGCSKFTLHHILSANSRGLHVCPLFSLLPLCWICIPIWRGCHLFPDNASV